MKTDPIPESKQPFGWPFWLLLLVLLFLFVGVVTRWGKPTPRKPRQTEAVTNLRQVGLALFEFEHEYGAYPNDETAIKLRKKTKTDLDFSGTSSNAIFRQLLAAGIIQSEQIFYAKVAGTEKPDGNFSEANALAPGEVAFGYIAGLSTKGNPARPIAFCPIIPGTDRFDPEPFDGKAVILRIDNSVASLKINEDGHAVTASGQPLLSPDNPIWNGHVPDIRYPDLPTPKKPNFFQKLFTN